MIMKRISTAFVALACAAMAISCTGKKTTVSQGNPAKMDSLSYCLGVNVGSSIKEQMSDIPFDIETVKRGVQEGATKTSKQSAEEAIEILREFFTMTLGERRQSLAEIKADSTSSAAAKFFENAEECEEISYAFGNDIGNNMRMSKLPMQLHWLLKGLQDTYEGSTEISKEDAMSFLQNYFMVVRPAEAAERSQKWLKKVSRKFGVKQTESGLCYKVVKAGDMEKAAKDDRDTVEVHYVGKLQDGTVFDASRFEDRSEEQKEMIRASRPDLFDNGKFVEEDKPVKFPLNRVIKGWGEGVKLVGPGGIVKLYIPAELAYGQRGAGRDIGPNEALEFEVEVISVSHYPVEEPVLESAPAEAPAEASEAAPEKK